MNRQPGVAAVRSRPQWAMAVMTLAYLLLLWWYSTPFFTLIQLGVVTPLSILFGAAGAGALFIGVLRQLANARKGALLFLFAAIALGAAGWLIGFRDYLIGKKLLAVFVAGLVLAITGAALAFSQKKTLSSLPAK